jgi:ubiquinone/menaquinone biosynthesis C-methylase UbiE
MDDAYAGFARLYDPVIGRFNSRLRSIGMRMVPPADGMHILDVGCGTGSLLEQYERAGCRVSGIDTSPAMLEIAGRRLSHSADLRLDNAADMPFADGTFDLVTASLILHELSPDIRIAVLGEMGRVLKKNGRVLITDYNPGPVRRLRGWMTRIAITVAENIAGGEHVKNYRQFMAGGGLYTLLHEHRLVIEEQKIVGGGTIGLYVLVIS